MAKKKSKTRKSNNEPSSRKSKTKGTGQTTLLRLGLILALLSFILYSNTLNHDFALDDGSAISENWVTKKGVAGIPIHLTKHYRYGYWNSKGVLYRPVSMVMFAIEWGIAPDNPKIHHAINVLLYAATALLLFLTLAEILAGYHLLLPFAASLLFLVHPVHVETVANIKSRDEMLAFFFSLLAINFIWKYLKREEVKWMIAAVLAYGLAMFSKEGVITLLAVFPLTIYFFLPKISLEKILKVAGLMIIPAVLYLLIRAQVLGDVAAGSGGSSPLDNVLYAAPDAASRLATAFLILGKYLLTLFFPFILCSDYGYNQIEISSWTDWRVILAFLVHLAMAVYAFKNIQKRSPLVYGILLYGITFSIYANVIITIGSSYAERFLYIPSLGFTIAIAALLLQVLKIDIRSRAPQELGDWWSKLSLPLLLIAGIAFLYSTRTILRNPAWKDSYTLYTTDLPNSPNSAKLNYHQALETVKIGLDTPNPQEKKALFDKAIQGFQKAIGIYPTYADAHGELGLSWYRTGEKAKAMAAYEEALKHNPRKATVYSNMGILYFEQRNLSKAEEVYKQAIKYDPRFVDALRNLGSVYAMQKRFPEAITQFQEGLKYEPNSAILHFYMGSVYRDMGQAEKGAPYLQKAYQLDPSLKR